MEEQISEEIVEKTEENKPVKGKALKAGVAYTICTFLLKGMAFLTMPIFTRIMVKSDIGLFSTMSSWISILSVVVTLSLYNSVPIAKYDYKKDFKAYISSIAIFSLIPAVVFGIIVFALGGFVSDAIGLPKYSIYIALIYLVFCSSLEILQCQLRVEYKYKSFVIITLASALITLAASLILVNTMSDGFMGRAIGGYVPLIIISFVAMIFLIVRGRSFKWKHIKYALVISLPLVIHGLASTIMHSSDRIMIQALCDSDSVALYSVAYSGALLVNMLRNSMESAWDPWVFDMLSEDNRQRIRSFSYPYILFFVAASIGIIFLAPEFLWLMGGKGYVEAMYVVPPVVLAYVCSMFYSLYGGLERYYKKQIVFPIFGSICAATNIGLNFLFIPIYGYIAAAYTTLICCFMEMLFHFLFCKKLKVDNTYNTKFNILILLICGGFTALGIFLYNYSIIRYSVVGALVLIVIVFVIVKRQWIKDYIKTIRTKKPPVERKDNDEVAR